MTLTDIAGWGSIAVIAGGIYFLPSLQAHRRQHRNTVPIFLVNLALGWTLLGWLAALVWANTSNVRCEQTQAGRDALRPPAPSRSSAVADLATLADLRERGHLTPDEYERQKAEVLKTPR